MKRLLLCSGGLDSVAVALVERPYGILFVDYGQPAAVPERASAQRVALYLGAKFFAIEIKPSPYTAAMHSGWMPARNGLLARLAVPLALSIGCPVILFGFVDEQSNPFPDTTSKWIRKVNKELRQEGIPLLIDAPYAKLTKRELVRLVVPHRRPLLYQSHSCIYPTPCLKCPKCVERIEALESIR